MKIKVPHSLVAHDAGTAMLIEMAAIEEGQARLSLGKWPWNPVEQQAKAHRMAERSRRPGIVGACRSGWWRAIKPAT